MRFWDSSAVVPLLVGEATSGRMLDLLRDDSDMVVWWGTRVECVSALRRRERDGTLTAPQVQRASRRLDRLFDRSSQVLPTANVRALAERALAVHPLRAADALQLAAAQAWKQGYPGGASFVCLDERVRDVAAREGFSPLPSEPASGA